MSNLISINKTQNEFFLKGAYSLTSSMEIPSNFSIENLGCYQFTWGEVLEQAAGSSVIWHISLKIFSALAHDEINQNHAKQQLFKYLQDHYPEYTAPQPLYVAGLKKGWAVFPGVGIFTLSIAASITDEQSARKWIMHDFIYNLFKVTPLLEAD